MDCHEVDIFLMEMDNRGTIPPEISQHLKQCDRCRAELEKMTELARALAPDSDAGNEMVDAQLSHRIMTAIRSEAGVISPENAADQPTSLRNWIIVGTLMLAGLFGLRFSEVMESLRDALGPAIDIAMSVILGIFLTGYICMLVASNIGRVGRVFRVRLR